MLSRDQPAGQAEDRRAPRRPPVLQAQEQGPGVVRVLEVQRAQEAVRGVGSHAERGGHR